LDNKQDNKDKLRVYEYAKSINMSSKEIITILKRLDLPVNNHMSVMENEMVSKVEGFFRNIKANAAAKRAQDSTSVAVSGASQAQNKPAAQQSQQEPKNTNQDRQGPVNSINTKTTNNQSQSGTRTAGQQGNRPAQSSSQSRPSQGGQSGASRPNQGQGGGGNRPPQSGNRPAQGGGGNRPAPDRTVDRKAVKAEAAVVREHREPILLTARRNPGKLARSIPVPGKDKEQLAAMMTTNVSRTRPSRDKSVSMTTGKAAATEAAAIAVLKAVAAEINISSSLRARKSTTRRKKSLYAVR
jgi:hypothetical protein